MVLYLEDLREEDALERELDRMLTVAEAGELLGVSKTTIRRLANSGKLRSYRVGPGKHRRFRKRDVIQILKLENNYG
ncbi:MAG: helix-turn-helix domain-containing protein [bacterium]|nr:helix-turn-helix domain-containing protein [bacterium]